MISSLDEIKEDPYETFEKELQGIVSKDDFKSFFPLLMLESLIQNSKN